MTEQTAGEVKPKAKPFIIIGCKLPNGLRLEIGQTVAEKNHEGKLITQVRKEDNYQSFTLRGWNHHNKNPLLQLPHGMDQSPYLNHGVPREFWEEWKRQHPRSWLLKNEIIFEANDVGSANLRKMEGDNTPRVLAPLNKKELPKDITEAEFAEERKRGGG